MSSPCHRFEREALLDDRDKNNDHFASCADCTREQAAYLRLQEALEVKDSQRGPPPGWQDEVLRRIHGGVRSGIHYRRTRWWWAVPAAAALGAVSLLLKQTSVPGTPGIEMVALSNAGPLQRGGTASKGDRIRVTGRTDRSFAEIRVFRDGRELVLRCPGDTRCRQEPGQLMGEFLAASPGRYDAIVVTADTPLASPMGTLEQDADRMLRDGALLLPATPIWVW